MGQFDLTDILPQLDANDANDENDENVLLGIGDDAGVYRVSSEIAIVQTTDFITPIVDDPRSFGRIAAANALSDVFAMGGEAKTALALVMHDSQNVPIAELREIIAGGLDKIAECGAALIGGHSVNDIEMKYGLSVTGFVHPQRFWRRRGAVAGDALILTKPLGIGIITTAAKQGQVTKVALDEAIAVMTRLNIYAARAAKRYEIHACTDITGFGLIGHTLEMADGVSLEIAFDRVPYMRAAATFAKEFVPGGSRANFDYARSRVAAQKTLTAEEEIILFDAQTSGGLLIALPSDQARSCLEAIRTAGDERAEIIGYARDRTSHEIVIV